MTTVIKEKLAWGYEFQTMQILNPPKIKTFKDKGTLLNDKRVHLQEGTAILYMYVHNTGAKYMRQEQRECKKK